MPYAQYDLLTGTILATVTGYVPDLTGRGQIVFPEGLDPGKYSIDLITLQSVALPDSPPDSAADA